MLHWAHVCCVHYRDLCVSPSCLESGALSRDRAHELAHQACQRPVLAHPLIICSLMQIAAEDYKSKADERGDRAAELREKKFMEEQVCLRLQGRQRIP